MFISSPVSVAPSPTLQPRYWGPEGFQSTTPTATACANFTLPQNGRIVVNESYTVSWSSSQPTYLPSCGDAPGFFENTTQPIADEHERFYASVVPLTFVIAACTFAAWFLLIILFLLPGSYVGFTRRKVAKPWKPFTFNIFRYISERPRAGSSRPWLQKVAAFLVVLALTVVTAETFRFARDQFQMGYLDADELRYKVTGSQEVKIIRVISDLFLWLAQIQTLIRLFPRHKEKLIIKWVGFLLICLDIIFSCINSFVIDTPYQKPVDFSDAISALSYTFQLSINLLYAAWVLYYSLTKRKYAFWHPLMPSISIIALFSIVSILIPVVFFLVDIVDVWVSTWGDYFRWLGSAASSIVVWEWVERIEALETDEKRDGILGQEVFEEDEADHRTMSSRTSIDNDDARAYSSDTTATSNHFPIPKWRSWTDRLANVHMPRKRRRLDEDSPMGEKIDDSPATIIQRDSIIRRSSVRHGLPEVTYPERAASPPDRKQTTSTGSTVYAVHYHPVTQTPPANLSSVEEPGVQRDPFRTQQPEGSDDAEAEEAAGQDSLEPLNQAGRPSRGRWNFATNPFRRSRKSPPLEIKNAMSSQQDPERGSVETNGRPALIIGRFNPLSGRQRHQTTDEPPQAKQRPMRSGTGSSHRRSPTEPTVIAAPPSGQTWSPETQTHSPIHHLGTPESLDGSVARLASAAAARSNPAVATPREPFTPIPARLAGEHSAAYDFGSTPPPPSQSAPARISTPTGDGQARDVQ